MFNMTLHRRKKKKRKQEDKKGRDATLYIYKIHGGMCGCCARASLSPDRRESKTCQMGLI